MPSFTCRFAGAANSHLYCFAYLAVRGCCGRYLLAGVSVAFWTLYASLPAFNHGLVYRVSTAPLL